MERILICGGDLRQKTVADILKKEKFDVSSLMLYENNEIENFDLAAFDTVIFPVPCTTEELKLNCMFENKPDILSIIERLKYKINAYGGRFPKPVLDALNEKNINAVDLLEDEAFNIKNAYLTSEGALKVALEASKKSLFKSKALIIGYGRIGKCLAKLLRTLGVSVTVSARKEKDRAWCEVFGQNAIEPQKINGIIGEFDFVFNTVPVQISDISLMNKKAVFIELASKPYGEDYELSCSFL